ncbi:unnamed protein product [Tilletia caries]|uniref:HMG box domain-containing protein n=1 Tax=Tilletia caries TaxID=13290 RepID=A0ABN7IXT9_9BASI|nr:hypothetical protein CF335_g2250 [Tilletia laevis]CAD6930188.1 unnamed protein product [Tilletia caries]CAD6952674.1 unnamed protein product [Tilletia caries]CAD6964935.1 unnamed protein product [Tilletia controversa]
MASNFDKEQGHADPYSRLTSPSTGPPEEETESPKTAVQGTTSATTHSLAPASQTTNLDPEMRSQAPRSDGGPRRPMNAFLLFSRYRRKEAQLAGGSSITTAQFSAMLGEEWRKLSDERRKFWRDQATQVREQFNREFPSYRYSRTKRKSKSDKGSFVQNRSSFPKPYDGGYDGSYDSSGNFGGVDEHNTYDTSQTKTTASSSFLRSGRVALSSMPDTRASYPSSTWTSGPFATVSGTTSASSHTPEWYRLQYPRTEQQGSFPSGSSTWSGRQSSTGAYFPVIHTSGQTTNTLMPAPVFSSAPMEFGQTYSQQNTDATSATGMCASAASSRATQSGWNWAADNSSGQPFRSYGHQHSASPDTQTSYASPEQRSGFRLDNAQNDMANEFGAFHGSRLSALPNANARLVSQSQALSQEQGATHWPDDRYSAPVGPSGGCADAAQTGYITAVRPSSARTGDEAAQQQPLTSSEYSGSSQSIPAGAAYAQTVHERQFLAAANAGSQFSALNFALRQPPSDRFAPLSAAQAPLSQSAMTATSDSSMNHIGSTSMPGEGVGKLHREIGMLSMSGFAAGAPSPAASDYNNPDMQSTAATYRSRYLPAATYAVPGGGPSANAIQLPSPAEMLASEPAVVASSMLALSSVPENSAPDLQ